MSGTLAEAKAELGYVQRQIDEHKSDDGCWQCGTIRGKAKRCAERVELEARAKALRADIKTWFDPPPGSAQLDLDLGLES